MEGQIATTRVQVAAELCWILGIWAYFLDVKTFKNFF